MKPFCAPIPCLSPPPGKGKPRAHRLSLRLFLRWGLDCPRCGEDTSFFRSLVGDGGPVPLPIWVGRKAHRLTSGLSQILSCPNRATSPKTALDRAQEASSPALHSLGVFLNPFPRRQSGQGLGSSTAGRPKPHQPLKQHGRGQQRLGRVHGGPREKEHLPRPGRGASWRSSLCVSLGLGAQRPTGDTGYLQLIRSSDQW